MVSVHTESKTQLDDRSKYRAALAVARACYGTSRLLPIVFRHRIIGWCGWSFRENCAIVLHHKPWMRTWIDRNGLLLGFQGVDDLIYYLTVKGNLRQSKWFKCAPGASPQALTWNHLFEIQGWPAAGLWNGTAFTARQHDDTELGPMMHGGNVTPATKHLLSGMVRVADQQSAAEHHVMVLYDMVISYDQCVVTTTPTNFTNTLTAQRYIDSGAGPGLQIMGCAKTATAGNTSYSSLKYTSVSGTAGQTPPVSMITVVNGTPNATQANAGSVFGIMNTNQRSFLTVPLVNGDGGVKQLDSITMGTLLTEQNNYILGYLLAWMPLHGGDTVQDFDFVRDTTEMIQVRDGACLTWAMQFGSGGASVSWQADLAFGWA